MIRAQKGKSHVYDNPTKQGVDICLAAALKYAIDGFRIVPCHTVLRGTCSCIKRENCKSAGKHPRVKDWNTVATCDAAKIGGWWRLMPEANVGVATGAASGIVAFDFDGDEGERTLQELANDDESIRDTLIHRSGSGGIHLLYRHPGWPVANAVRLQPGMDIRGDGGLIIFPPSQHSSGGRYSIQNDREIADLPPFLRALITPCHKEREGVLRNVQELEGELKQGESWGKRHSKKMPTIPKGQIEQALRDSMPKVPGTRNRQVFALARHLLMIDGINQDIPAIEFRQIVERWHQMAVYEAAKRGFSIIGDIEESWSDFRYGWGKVKHPVGAALRPVFDEVFRMDSDGEIEPLAWNSLQYFRRTEDRAMRLLIGVVFELAQRAGNEPFQLAVDAGAQQFKRIGAGDNITGKWVHRRLKLLVDDGILACIDKGQSGSKSNRKAAQYRWIWTIQDPPANQFG